MKTIPYHILEPHLSRHNTFIETGTYHGNYIRSVHDKFVHCYTIEIQYEIWNATYSKLKEECKNVEFLLGDSQIVLPELLSRIDKSDRCILLLDAHLFRKDDGAKLEILKNEIAAILDSGRREDVIFVDDIDTIYGDIRVLFSSILAINSRYNFRIYSTGRPFKLLEAVVV
jgi:hypothetical protein